MSDLAIELIRNKRDQLLAELSTIQERYGKEILELNQSLVALTGKNIAEVEDMFKYDDESPDYIKNNEDGL